MALYFGGISAFAFWRSQDARDNCPRARLSALSTTERDYAALGPICTSLPIQFEGNVQLCVDAAGKRKQRTGISYIVMRCPPCLGSFLRIADKVYVASPELCYLQMARYLSPVQLTKWGMELCGSYRIDMADGELAARKSGLSSAKCLQAFLKSTPERKWVRKARESARWIMDGSASPPESQLALCFRMPRKCGGNGLGVPFLNYRIALTAEMQRKAGKSCYYVDEFWPKGNLAVEYESDAFHSSSYRAALDRRRRNLLQSIGVKVVTVNTGQLANLMEIDDLAAQIAACTGMRQRAVSASYPQKHAQLHRQLIRTDFRFRL